MTLPSQLVGNVIVSENCSVCTYVHSTACAKPSNVFFFSGLRYMCVQEE